VVQGVSGPEAARRFFGVHRRSKRWAYRVMARSAAVVALMGILGSRQDYCDLRVAFIGAAGVLLFCWGVYQRLDNRPYLDISPEGIWCRRWGPERIGFDALKAVYLRKSGLNLGVALVPRAPEALKAELSLRGRLSLRSGDFGVTTAHAGTLTIWANRLDLPAADLLAALQSLVVGAAARRARTQ
jgi:hypothetical protein